MHTIAMRDQQLIGIPSEHLLSCGAGGARRRKLARQSRGVLPSSPTNPSSRMTMSFQPDIFEAECRWIRSPMSAVRDVR
jgi:hypothetical protein